MKKKWMTAALLLAAACGAASVNAQSESTFDATATSLAAQEHEVSIMAQVLSEKVKDLVRRPDAAPALAADEKAALGFIQDATTGPEGSVAAPVALSITGATPFRTGKSGVSGQYIPTLGAVFNLTTDFPLVKPEQPADPAPAASGSAAGDLWTQFSQPAEVRLGSTRARTAGEPIQFDQAAVDKLRAAILATLTEYGPRMASLSPDERIVVIVRGPGVQTRSVSMTGSRVGYGSSDDRMAISLPKEDLVDGKPIGERDARRQVRFYQGPNQSAIYWNLSDRTKSLTTTVAKPR